MPSLGAEGENVKPVADAGVNQSVVGGDTVYLDGSGSFGANLDRLIYSWSSVSKPTNSLPGFDDPASEQTSFVADLPCKYIVSLAGDEGCVDSGPSKVTIVGISVQDAITQSLECKARYLTSIRWATFYLRTEGGDKNER